MTSDIDLTPGAKKLLEYLLAHGKSYATDIGATLWPMASDRTPSNGGPSAQATIAAFQCGKLAKQGWVESVDIGRGPSRWRLTSKGKKIIEQNLRNRSG